MSEEQEIVVDENAGAPAEIEPTESATGEQQEPQQPEAPETPAENVEVQKRIRELTAARKRAEEEREYWRQEALKQAKAETPAPVAPPVDTGKPKAENFEDNAAFVEALTDWKIEQRDKAAASKTQESELRQKQQAQVQTFQQKQQEFKAVTPDFDDVIATADFPVSIALLEEVKQHDNGPAFQYWLAKNPAEADRLSKMPAIQLAREVGRLETRFSSTPAAKPAPVTRTAAPITPVTTNRTSSASSASLDVDDFAEFERRRNAQLKR